MTNIFQFDDVTVSLIGPGAAAVLGYSDGDFANRTAMKAAFPNALQTFLTVHGTDFTADGVDSEKGDATTEQVVAFGHVKHQQGKRPVFYTFLANMEAMAQAVFASGIKREDAIFMCAHVTGVPHICGPQCGLGLSFDVDATQYTFTAEGRSLDESWCTPAYFLRDLVPPKPPKPKDPYHYYWFTDAVRREHVMTYDELRRHPLKNRKELKRLREQLKHGAHSVALGVINRAKISGKPRDWSHDRAGWRYQNLIKRANGKRIVR